MCSRYYLPYRACVAGTTYLKTPTPELTPVFSVVLVAQSLFYCVLFCGPFVDFCFNLFGRCWSFCPLFFDLRLMITPLVSSHFWSLCCLSYDLRLMITPLVSSHFWSLYRLSYDLLLMITLLVSSHFGHSIVCPMIYGL